MKRTRLLSAGRVVALGLFIAIAAALVVYLVFRSKHPQPDPTRPKLQGKVVAVFSNTHYSHEVGGRVRFNITAGTDRTYEDGTHELEQVKIESYGSQADRHDVVTADRAKVSDPSDLSRLDAELMSNVVVQTSEGLTVKTSYLHYDQVKNTIDTKELVEFEGRNYAGRATGVILEANDERARLLKDVDVTIKPESESDKDSKAKAVASGGGHRDETPEERAARKARKRARKEARRSAADLIAKQDAPSPSASRVERKSPSSVPSSKKPTRIRSESALLEKKEHRATFDG